MGLHARKKGVIHDTENPPDIPPSPNSEGTSSRGHKKGRKLLPNDIKYALSAVGGFLFVGIMCSYFLLHHQHRKVIAHIMADPWGHTKGLRSMRVGFRHHFFTGNPRSVTVVMPSVVNTKGRKQRLDSILETWGPSARAVYVVHNVSEFPKASHAVISDHRKPQNKYSYPQLMLVPSSIGEDDGLPRLNYVIRSVYEKINPDFAFFVNDHTFVLPEHLCYYLEDKEPTADLYAGHALKNQKDVFNSGAAGYVLSRTTMRRLVQKWDEDDPMCVVKGNDWLQGNPGLVTTKCLKEALNISAVDTRDEGKWHRFHAFPLTRVVAGDVDQWYNNKHKNMHEMMDTDESYNTLLSGPDCCAEDTVSFHYVESFESRALFGTRERLMDNPHMNDRELKALMLAEWPHERHQIGAYSKGLPRQNDDAGWTHLLRTIRRISQTNLRREC